MTFLQANSELQIIIRQQLNEDLNTRDSYLEALKEWLLQEPHLPDTWDDVPLLNFLRGCSFSLEKCKKKLDSYFTMRTAAPEFFCNRNFKNTELLEMTKMVYHIPLPNLTKDGYRVILLRFKYKNILSSMEESFKIHFIINDIRLKLEETGVAGDVYILDAETLTSHHILLMTPTTLKKYIIGLLEVYPNKVKEIHVININPFVNVLYTLIKPFLKKKFRDRMHFHTDGLESLYKFIPREGLPEEYGGNAGKLEQSHDAWMQKLEEYEEWFAEQENVKSDESKRLGKSIDSNELFGIEGSFKQLNVD